MNPYGTVITDAGAEAIAAALLEGRKLPVIWAAAGDGNGRKTVPGRDQTALVHELWRGEIVSAALSPVTPNMIDVRFTLPDEAGGFIIRELGLFSDSGVLVAVGNTPDTEKAAISQGVSGRLTVTMHLLLADASVLEFAVNPSLDMVSREELEAFLRRALEAHNEDPEAHPALLEKTAGLDARVALLELMYATDVSGNPFLVTFGSLEGVEAEGVWNVGQARIEF